MTLNHFYLIISSSQRTSRTGRAFTSLKVVDLESSFLVTVWGTPPLSVGSLISFTKVSTKDDLISCSPSDFLVTSPSPDNPLLSLLPSPVTFEEWTSLNESISTLFPEYSSIYLQISSRLFKLFEPFPAGKSNHHAYAGGLATHTYQILHMFYSLYSSGSLNFLHPNPFVVAVSALFHDAAKVHCYSSSFDYTPYGSLINHVAGSFDMASQVLRSFKLPESLLLQIQHCILAHHELLEYGSPVRPSTVEAEIVAMLDRISGHGSQIYENATPEGVRIPNLETTVYKFES